MWILYTLLLFFSTLSESSCSRILLPHEFLLTRGVRHTQMPKRKDLISSMNRPCWATSHTSLQKPLTMLGADALWWLCYASVLQSQGACIPNSQHLHRFVRGLPSGCRRPGFPTCTKSRQCLWIYIPLPPQAQPFTNDLHWSINTAAPSPHGIVCDSTHLSPNL